MMESDKTITAKARRGGKTARLKYFAGLSFMLDLADSYTLRKENDAMVVLEYHIGGHKTTIKCHIIDVVEYLGKWLAVLPHNVFDERQKKVEQFNKDMG